MSAAQISTVHYSPDVPLPERLLAQLRALVADAERTDHNPAFSDQTWVELRRGGGAAGVLLATATETDAEADETLIGAAALVSAGDADLVEAVVAEPARGTDIGGQLIAGLLESRAHQDLHSARELTAWSHGDHPAARKLAARYGLAPVRELWRMGVAIAELDETTLQVAPPEGYRFRTFNPDSTDDRRSWLAVNAAAFADHPEQGQLTEQDLAARIGEDWFDPAGFFLAERESDGALQGFHWTKVPADQPADQPRVGEVYAVGVAPEAQGSGLGRALTARGMAHLAGLDGSRALDKIVLYVDEENTAATRLYTSLGFAVENIDVMFSDTQRLP